MLAFRHAGDLGDIIYSLPIVKTLCQSTNLQAAILIEAARYTRQPLTPDRWCGINELLMRQPYVRDVRPFIPGERVNYNLNDFRARLFPAVSNGHYKDKHLMLWMCESHDVNPECMVAPWLTLEDPIFAGRVIFSRAGPGREARHVYQNEKFPWYAVAEKYRKDAVFVGSPLEHEVFTAQFGPVPYYETKTLLEAARVIAGAELFCGNQTATHAIAEGFKKKIVLEVWRGGPNCLVFRDGVVHGWDQKVADQLPELTPNNQTTEGK